MTNDRPAILLLDDEESILNSLKRSLHKVDAKVNAFTSGTQAIAHIRSQPVDLIISDMRMPEMDGAEFLYQSQKIQPNTIRILLTGYADIDSVTKAVNQGKIHNYLHKPWEHDDLITIINDSLEKVSFAKRKNTIK
ncbi:response regulator [Piscirickettsia litoralis]|uniref:Response regulatory domain-containing protein n=1 Tax=Piscirickettsia litoralis TaxID=1891921 RepID=A0ABX2ZZJ7_9GAMM|nr:response regulator [Piscirickettsia litoralis]ODN41938.1 hypothetical protein BGC07_01870 [Piscirickettsia litoralis]